MKNPIIIGAGISGLVAAIELEKAGYSPTILEATDRVGGRVNSENQNGLPLDHGFQVLLTEYPEAQRYLDYDKLDLLTFLPGSVIFKNNKIEKIGDPLRDFSFLWSTLSANIGSIKDKILILKLSLSLKNKSIETIFSKPEKSTQAYLQDYGFSENLIANFFQPFFAGIYLEEDLDTSSRMFEFVYKMFGSGHAAIPRNGMQAIPDQLASQLKQTTIRYNTTVKSIEGNTITLDSDEQLSAEKIIIAVDPAPFFATKKITLAKWKSCYNLYFESSKSVLKNPIIGLLPSKELLVNNFHFLNDLFAPDANMDKTIMSVTVVKDHNLSKKELILKVKEELKNHCNIETGKVLRLFHIPKALPKIKNLKYQPTKTSATLAPGIFCCGDYLANGSLNAAMASGRVAARLVSKD
ncbi:FAD-dependent oxidoreductase [Bacteroidia bacterium]|nr:FAD-dependent oxidoreductase [Bacteroidia bacterium]MDB4107462.1 FAD-dependent oxidoreductase [Bacteroidia bacterium]MDB9881635.1 FAD-dependent oxidoreductase [Bacteroidia bacterium]